MARQMSPMPAAGASALGEGERREADGNQSENDGPEVKHHICPEILPETLNNVSEGTSLLPPEISQAESAQGNTYLVADNDPPSEPLHMRRPEEAADHVERPREGDGTAARHFPSFSQLHLDASHLEAWVAFRSFQHQRIGGEDGDQQHIDDYIRYRLQAMDIPHLLHQQHATYWIERQRNHRRERAEAKELLAASKLLLRCPGLKAEQRNTVNLIQAEAEREVEHHRHVLRVVNRRLSMFPEAAVSAASAEMMSAADDPSEQHSQTRDVVAAVGEVAAYASLPSFGASLQPDVDGHPPLALSDMPELQLEDSEDEDEIEEYEIEGFEYEEHDDVEHED